MVTFRTEAWRRSQADEVQRKFTEAKLQRRRLRSSQQLSEKVYKFSIAEVIARSRVLDERANSNQNEKKEMNNSFNNYPHPPNSEEWMTRELYCPNCRAITIITTFDASINGYATHVTECGSLPLDELFGPYCARCESCDGRLHTIHPSGKAALDFWESLARKDLTPQDIEKFIGHDSSFVFARTSEMRRDGELVGRKLGDSYEKRPTRSGRLAVVLYHHSMLPPSEHYRF
jgi:hypothetical protein